MQEMSSVSAKTFSRELHFKCNKHGKSEIRHTHRWTLYSIQMKLTPCRASGVISCILYPSFFFFLNCLCWFCNSVIHYVPQGTGRCSRRSITGNPVEHCNFGVWIDCILCRPSAYTNSTTHTLTHTCCVLFWKLISTGWLGVKFSEIARSLLLLSASVVHNGRPSADWHPLASVRWQRAATCWICSFYSYG